MEPQGLCICKLEHSGHNTPQESLCNFSLLWSEQAYTVTNIVETLCRYLYASFLQLCPTPMLKEENKCLCNCRYCYRKTLTLKQT